MPRVRADELLVRLGLARDRAHAAALIMAGQAHLQDRRIDKPGELLREDQRAFVKERARYVSRAGGKLEGALDAMKLSPEGLECADIGASTGGFTDCLLQRGAAKVYAIDVGVGLLHEKLRVDPRVVVMDKTHAKTLEPAMLGGGVDWITVDASFIRARDLLPALAPLLKPRRSSALLVMVKPQFELPAALVPGGVVHDDAHRHQALALVVEAAGALGLRAQAHVDSAVAGPKGNREIFVHLQLAAP